MSCFGGIPQQFGKRQKKLRKGYLEDKVHYNEQKNISAIEKKEKKQTRF
jgi:hypothetical protein